MQKIITRDSDYKTKHEKNKTNTISELLLESILRKLKFKKCHFLILFLRALFMPQHSTGLNYAQENKKKLNNDIFSILPYVISTLVAV